MEASKWPQRRSPRRGWSLESLSCQPITHLTNSSCCNESAWGPRRLWGVEVVVGPLLWAVQLGVVVGPGRRAGISSGRSPRPALRTGRATLTASGSPRAHAAGAGDPGSMLAHGVGMRVPRKRYRTIGIECGRNISVLPSRICQFGRWRRRRFPQLSPPCRLRSQPTILHQVKWSRYPNVCDDTP